ncbi:unnamed protein product [Vicia faba]|uniref:Uncharacterized protein n=1 Tax=Vicia faba TaxID=3906 RepID=A0AAV1A227_VICFA|nr:unnamed protein product [Vicia faba]
MLVRELVRGSVLTVISELAVRWKLFGNMTSRLAIFMFCRGHEEWSKEGEVLMGQNGRLKLQSRLKIISSFHRFIVSSFEVERNRFSKSLQVAIASQNRFRVLYQDQLQGFPVTFMALSALIFVFKSILSTIVFILVHNRLLHHFVYLLLKPISSHQK